MTSTPATLASPFYKCCNEKNSVEKLSEANAFAGLVQLKPMLIFGALHCNVNDMHVCRG